MIFRTFFRFSAALALIGSLCMPAGAADPIAYWDFNSLSIPSTGTPAALGITSIAPTSGTASLSLTGYTGNIDDFSGSALNAIPLNPPGNGNVSLSLLPGAGLAGNDDFIEFQFDMTGRTNLGVSYATQGTATGFVSNQWSYSTDGTNYTNFGPVITPAIGSYGLVGPLVTSALDNVATAYLRYTVGGGTNAGGNNRVDNVRLEFNATPAPPLNPAVLPQPGDIVLGTNNTSAATTIELVRGAATASGGVRFASPWTTQNFIQSVEFDNLGGQPHNARGNLLGVNFAVGGGANSGAIYSFATKGSIPAPTPQLIGNTCSTCSAALGNAPVGHDGSLAASNLSGLSVSPDNTKVAVVGTTTGTVIVYDYTAGDMMGAGASLANGRQTSTDAATRILPTGATQGTAWKDNNTVLAFSTIGDVYEVNATTMTPTFIKNQVTPQIGGNVTSLAYNPEVSPYLYALYSGFNTNADPDSQTKLYVFDPANSYATLTDADGVDLSLSSQTGREIALDKAGNLFISAFDSTITFIPSSAAQSPATITDNSSVYWYQSPVNASAFVGFDIGFGGVVPLVGDYNNDGTVDAADYVVWRRNDINGQQGYDDWRKNFGRTAGNGSALGAGAVPEPASMALILIGLAGVCRARRGA
jgi:hypothetical protein